MFNVHSNFLESGAVSARDRRAYIDDVELHKGCDDKIASDQQRVNLKYINKQTTKINATFFSNQFNSDFI